MSQQQTDNKKGFTIIEVVLVLAIAGLIFLMVFIALPALQRSQRDTQRRNDLSRMQTAVQNYQTNSRGSLPTNWTTFKAQYLIVGGDTFTDPNGNDYTITAGAAPASASFNAGSPTIYAASGSVCNPSGSGGLLTNQGNRKIAFQMALEGGGLACVNN